MPRRSTTTGLLIAMCFGLTGAVLAQDQGKLSEKEQAQAKGRSVVEQAVEAMGGARYRAVREMTSRGLYHMFKDGQVIDSAKFTDNTRLPDKSRFQLREGKNKELEVFDLAAGKGWRMEGKTDIKDATPEEMQLSRQAVKHSLENLLRGRLSEAGLTLFYYGPEEIPDRPSMEAVEIIDAENDSVLVYFDLKTHLPARMEYVALGARGNKHKQAVEFYVWHSVNGVMTPFRTDIYSDGQMVSQLFIDQIVYNPTPPLSDSLFTRPTPDK